MADTCNKTNILNCRWGFVDPLNPSLSATGWDGKALIKDNFLNKRTLRVL